MDSYPSEKQTDTNKLGLETNKDVPSNCLVKTNIYYLQCPRRYDGEMIRTSFVTKEDLKTLDFSSVMGTKTKQYWDE